MILFQKALAFSLNVISFFPSLQLQCACHAYLVLVLNALLIQM